MYAHTLLGHTSPRSQPPHTSGVHASLHILEAFPTPIGQQGQVGPPEGQNPPNSFQGFLPCFPFSSLPSPQSLGLTPPSLLLPPPPLFLPSSAPFSPL